MQVSNKDLNEFERLFLARIQISYGTGCVAGVLQDGQVGINFDC
jgi:hypothetical protein